MRAFGRAGWLLCRWPLEESIHAESYTDVSSILVCGRLTFPPIPTGTYCDHGSRK